MPRPKREPPETLWRKTGDALRRGDLDTAERLARALLAGSPRHAGGLHALGLIEFQRGRAADAVPLLRQAVSLAPNDESAHFNLGVVLHELGESADAAASHREAVAIKPDYAEAWSALSASLMASGAAAEAADAARRAVHLAPHLVAATANLSTALRRLGDDVGALETILVCIRRNPDSAEAWFWMGQTLHLCGEFPTAITAYDRAIAIDPNHILAHARRAIARLTLGDFARGWPEYEWRLRGPGANPRRLTQPQWNGDPLTGRTILLHAEQGLGDALQMLRYVEPVAHMAEHVLVEVDAALVSLVPRRANVTPVRRGGELPPFEVYCPLFSLPLAFGTTLDTIPGGAAYLQPDATRVAAWEAILSSAARGRRIGIAWAGNRRHQHDRERSIPFHTLTPLFSVPDVTWFSLQVGDAVDAVGAAEYAHMINLGPQLTDFGETAAAMAGLDLVITVDTSVAHLAGALGVPVWILLPTVPDFRWLLDRHDSPWYPSARLFRQRVAGDWNEPIEQIVRALLAQA